MFPVAAKAKRLFMNLRVMCPLKCLLKLSRLETRTKELTASASNRGNSPMHSAKERPSISNTGLAARHLMGMPERWVSYPKGDELSLEWTRMGEILVEVQFDTNVQIVREI